MALSYLIDTDVTVDRLIARHLEARGGLERILAIKTLRQRGTVKMPGAEVHISGERKRADLLLVQYTVAGRSGIEGWDGKAAWEFNPFKGMTEPQYVTGAPSEALQRGAEFDGPLVNHQEKGHTIEYIGTEKVGDRDTYHLKITRNDGNVIYYYLDIETMLTIRTRSVRPIHGGDAAETITDFSDYREVAGVLFPFCSHELARDGEHNETFHWQSIEANIPLSDFLFKIPK